MMLALDIGIKHLAYCVSDARGTIHHWSIVNLTEEVPIPPCITCAKPSKVKTPHGTVCGRHIPANALWIVDKGTTSSPTVPQLKTFLTNHQLPTLGKKDDLLTRAVTIASVWLPKPKNAMSFADNTTRLHDAIRTWITNDWAKLEHVTRVYIEHQPVLKNPVMKTVQLLIFASLRERYLANGKATAFYFVHAGKKVKGAAPGDEGYADRKKGGETRTETHLQTFPEATTQRTWLTWWQQQPKRDDLADALCMILDHVDKK
jgi:hypothetical protein